MGSKINSKVLKKEIGNRGQSTVEYVLLLVVVMVFVNTVIRSDTFEQFFGDNSTFFQTIATGMARSYRYADIVSEDEAIDESPSLAHPSYTQDGGSESRFFVTAEEYP